MANHALRHACIAVVIVSFDCEIGAVNKVGTHNVMFGRVVDIQAATRPRCSISDATGCSRALGSFGG